MKCFDQFRLLVWKNFVLQKRRPIATAVELLLPILFSLVLVFIRNDIDVTNYPNVTTWEKFNVTHLPPFKMDVSPKDNVWNVAYVPKSNSMVNKVMNFAMQRLNMDIPKTKLEIKCNFEMNLFIQQLNRGNSSRSAGNSSGSAGGGNLSSSAGGGNSSGSAGRGNATIQAARIRSAAASTYDQMISPMQDIVNETAQKENQTAIGLLMQVMMNGTINQFLTNIASEYQNRTIECIRRDLFGNSSENEGLPQNTTGSDSNMTSSLNEYLLSQLKAIPSIRLVSFESEEALLRYTNNDTNLKNLLAGVIFGGMTDNTASIPDDMKLTFRFHSEPINIASTDSSLFTGITNVWHTSKLFPEYQRPGPRSVNSTTGGKPGYYTEGFLSLMHSVNMGIASTVTNSTRDLSTFNAKRYPFPPYIDDPFITAVKSSIPLLIMLSFFYTALVIVRSVVQEKEARMKEYMKMMGLSNWLHWSAWFLKYILFLTISCFMISGLYKVKTSKGCVLTNSDFSVIFVFLFIFCVATINLCFMLSVFFSKANVGAAAGGVIYGLTYMPYLFMDNDFTSLSIPVRIIACLLSNVAMASGFNVVGMFEGKGTGIQWYNLNEGVTVDDNFTLLHVILMLLFDATLYMLVAIYVENVWPGEYGIPRPWNFPFKKSYWVEARVSESKYSVIEDPEHVDAALADDQFRDYFEGEPTDLRKTVEIKGLRKVFKNGKKEKVAVHNLNLNMYDEQITVLLGHNGAGKTTTMSMLTGFFPPTSGEATVNGYSITKNIAGVRKTLGLCPQFNILFDLLTVDEHLYFFSRLKGMSHPAAVKETQEMKAILKLEDKGSAKSSTLSGGMKRKLSVGIALSAGSKYVILDEPTSGMDPAARRAIWEVLQYFRSRCSMLLSTHFMDEADLLGDRIAIMAEGRLRCVGSSVFLKNTFGVGYHVVLTKSENCDVDKLTSIIQSYVPETHLERSAGAELSYVLPFNASPQFPQLFKTLEDESNSLGISGFGAVVTTMEEVFLRVTEDTQFDMRHVLRTLSSKAIGLQKSQNAPAEQPSSQERLRIEGDYLNTSFVLNTGTKLWLWQFYALIVKKILHSRRNYKVAVAQLLVPIFFATLAIISVKFPPFQQEIVPFDLAIDAYGPNNIYVDNPDALEFGKTYSQQFKDSIEHVAVENGDLDEYLAKRYVIEGGLFTSANLISASFMNGNGTNGTSNAIAWFNSQAYHTPATSLAYLDQAYLRMVTGRNFSMRYINYPLPRNSTNRIQEQLIGSLSGFMLAFNIVLGFSFLTASFCLFLVRERTDRAALMQTLAGVEPFCFWITAFIWDFINFMIPCFLMLVMFAIFNITEFTDHAGIVLLIFALYCWASLPAMYLLSFFFTVPSTALVRLIILNIITGLASLLTISILRLLELSQLADALNWFFLLMPPYCLGNGLADLYTNTKIVKVCVPFFESFCRSNGIDFQTNFLAFEQYGVGKFVLFLAIQGVVYFLILFMIEFKVFSVIWNRLRILPNTVSVESMNFDDDVAHERHRVNNTEQAVLTASDRLIIKNLSKVYGSGKGSLVAVHNLSIGIPENECFGLLGVNGAGKTSTFKMLTGDLSPTTGTAFLDGYDIRTHLRKVQQRMGYCPQFDALIEQMTGSETLRMYARLRGVAEADIPECIRNLGSILHFSEHLDKQCGTYSGGNKRKLSTAIALVGNPPVVLLDEPSTGMDPGARRMLWNALTSVRSSGRSIVITSHSMEECEALCTRLAIMVNGVLRCIGGPQHLKNKFSEGYTVEIKALDVDVKTYMKQNFPESKLREENQHILVYYVPLYKNNDEEVRLADVFEFMEKAKNAINFGEYTVTQTTLEQVFLSLVLHQRSRQSSVDDHEKH